MGFHQESSTTLPACEDKLILLHAVTISGAAILFYDAQWAMPSGDAFEEMRLQIPIFDGHAAYINYHLVEGLY